MGIVELELTGADIAGTLEALTAAGIAILGSEPVDILTLVIRISRKDYPLAVQLCQKRGDTLKLRKERGIHRFIGRICSRPVIIACFILLLFLTLYIPTRVLFVRVEGNEMIPANRILEAAEESGLCFGASRREVRSEELKNRLLEAMPELKWAGINTYGCVAVITVRERPTREAEEDAKGVCSIVAACDGIIISANATGGTLLCQPGQAVTSGQVLISGYTDCGLKLQAGTAEGEIIAQTRHEITVITPAVGLKRGENQGERVNYSILVGKKRINFWKDSGICDATCDRMYEEYYITLPGGFRLPIAIVKETVREYAVTTQACLPEDGWLEAFAENTLHQRMICGDIRKRNTVLHTLNGVCILKGNYLCTEMIGRQRQEEIGVIHGKSN